MIALFVDDEEIILNSMRRIVADVPEIEEAVFFTNEMNAIEWTKNHKIDVAFLDIQLHVMNGLELAEKLREYQPDIACVFCTAYSHYAVDAINMRLTDGYILKPVRANAIRERLKALNGEPEKKKALLYVTMKRFILVENAEGKRIVFERNKTRELFETLLKQNGKVLSTTDLCYALWEDNDIMYETNRRYLWTTLSYLRKTLASAGAESVLKRQMGGYCLDMSLIELR